MNIGIRLHDTAPGTLKERLSFARAQGFTCAHVALGMTLEGFPQTTVAFGSDTPRLSKFARRALCGPGSISVAHTAAEHILLQDIETAVEQYVRMACTLLGAK